MRVHIILFHGAIKMINFSYFCYIICTQLSNINYYIIVGIVDRKVLKEEEMNADNISS